MREPLTESGKPSRLQVVRVSGQDRQHELR
jgi:hypothetical protein